MKKAAILCSVLIILFLSGCTKSVRYTEEEIKSFPPNIQENVRKGQIDLGMTTEQVRYAWGNPDSVKFLPAYEGKSREEWIYSSMGSGVVGTKLLLFFDGKLIYIK
jgi:hypothetical protein